MFLAQSLAAAHAQRTQRVLPDGQAIWVSQVFPACGASGRAPVAGRRRPGRGVNLRGANLHGARLSGVILDGADLVGADLQHAALRAASLVEAYLTGARLQYASLVRAHLARARLSWARLLHAHLYGAYLREAHLQEANLQQAYLVGTDLSDVGTCACSGGLPMDFLRGCGWSDAQVAGLVGRSTPTFRLTSSRIEKQYRVQTYIQTEGGGLCPDYQCHC